MKSTSTAVKPYEKSTLTDIKECDSGEGILFPNGKPFTFGSLTRKINEFTQKRSGNFVPVFDFSSPDNVKIYHQNELEVQELSMLTDARDRQTLSISIPMSEGCYLAKHECLERVISAHFDGVDVSRVKVIVGHKKSDGQPVLTAFH